jgi:iron complex outermembrane receptor protein
MINCKDPGRRVRRHTSLTLLLAGASALGLSTAAAAQSTPADAQNTPEAKERAADTAANGLPGPGVQPGNAIVVTGTRISGVAPVGAAAKQITQADILATGLASTADILNTVPSVLKLGSGDSYAGGQAQQGNTLTAFTYSKSPNIRGLGVGATLSLVNGHRVPYEGANMNIFDGDNYPAQMLQRIEIVQDSGSALYGADAIAGTVNYILRRPENTLEGYAGYGTNDGQDTWYATAIGGVTWGSSGNLQGGIIASYQHSHQSAFAASSRPDLYNDDLSPYGGAPSSLFSAPGNVVVNGTYYAIPFGQDGTKLTLSDLGATPNRFNTWNGIEVIPEITADRLSGNFRQRLTDWLAVFADGLYVRRQLAINGPNSSTSNRVTTFGQLPLIPNSNPFSPCNPGHYAGGIVTGPADLLAACQTGALAVAYSTVYDIGPPMRTATTKTWSYGGGADIDLPYEWRLTVSAYAGTHDEPSVTTQTGGAPSPDLGTFNFFCDPTAFECTDVATAQSILARGLSLINRAKFDMQDYSAVANGKLFSLPGGDVKLAVGYERYNASLLNQNNFGGSNFNKRHVDSVFGELYVPIVGSGDSMPGLYKLELNGSARYDHYSDAGGTTNPRIGVNWWPVASLKLFGSWGTAFHAPGLADNDPYSQTGVIPGVASGTQISSSICPACQGPGYAFASIYQEIGGANRNLSPETAESYAIGADYKPASVPGLVVSAKYWHVSYDGQVNTPAYNVGPVAAINQQIYNSQIIYNPTLFPTLAANNPTAFFGTFPTINQSNPACAAVFGQKVTTQALFDAMITCYNTGGETGGLFGPPTSPGSVLALVNGRRINAGKTVGDGIDFDASYSFSSSVGDWNVGVVGTYTLGWKVSPIPGAPLVQEVNRFGYPLAFQGRGEIGWMKDFSFGTLSAHAFVNYRNSYRMDPGQLPVGVSSKYEKIASNTTFDLALTYNTGTAFHWWGVNDLMLTVSVQNVFDTDPPLVVNQAGLAGSAVRFDPTYGSPLGRVWQFQIGKKF